MTAPALMLDELAAPRVPIGLPGGDVALVHVYNAAGFQRVHAFRQLPPGDERADALLVELACLALRGTPRERVLELEPLQLLAVISVATGHADAVLDALAKATAEPETGSGNADAPAELALAPAPATT